MESLGSVIIPTTESRVLFSKDRVMTLRGNTGLFQSPVSGPYCSSPCSVFCLTKLNDLGDLPMESEDILLALN